MFGISETDEQGAVDGSGGGVQPHSATYADIHLMFDSQMHLTHLQVAQPGRSARLIDPSGRDAKELQPVVDAIVLKGADEKAILIDDVRYRVETMNSLHGPSVTLVPAGSPRTLDETVLDPTVSQKLLTLGSRRGLVLITGDFGSGKTTLMASLLRAWLEKYGGRCLEWGDPCEYALHGRWGDGFCIQMDIDTADYPSAARQTKRSRANFVAFGECRTDETFAAVLAASLDGPLYVTTSHGATPLAALTAFHAAAKRRDGNADYTLAAAIQAHLHVNLRHSPGGPPSLNVTPVFFDENIAAQARALIRNGDMAGLNDIYGDAGDISYR